MKAIQRTILVAGMLALGVPLTNGWQQAGTGKGPGGPAQVQQPSGPVKAPVQQQTGSPQAKVQQQTGPMQKPQQHQAGVRTMEASRKRLVTAERNTYEWHAQRKDVAQMMIRSEHTYRMQIAKIERMQ
ncbi:MAG: hypothetical protein KDC95_24120, partial [Planctomycetes bacterium]|nr:hypothetical protein [Planctomycetota bacterium]